MAGWLDHFPGREEDEELTPQSPERVAPGKAALTSRLYGRTPAAPVDVSVGGYLGPAGMVQREVRGTAPPHDPFAIHLPATTPPTRSSTFPTVQRKVTESQEPRFRSIYQHAGDAAAQREHIASPGATDAPPPAGATADLIFEFERRRNPTAAYDMTEAAESARAHAQPTRMDAGASGVTRRYAAVELDDASPGSHSIGSVDPMATEAAAGGPTLRDAFVQHRDEEVARLFGAGVTTADVIAARTLAEDASSSVGPAAGLAEAVRARLFIASEYATVHTLNPASSRRYDPGPGFTACNLYVFDALRVMGVPEEALPTDRSMARAEDRPDGVLSNATAGDANATADRFRSAPLSSYWEDLGQDADRAQTEASRGHIVICAGRGTHGAGHYSLVMAENDTREGARAHRGADGRVDSTLESQAGGGSAADAEGHALAEGASAPDGGNYHTANWNYDSRAARRERGAGADRSPQWWRVGHDGHFYLYRGGGVRTDADRSTYRGEDETSMGMDYSTRAVPAVSPYDGQIDARDPFAVHVWADHGVQGNGGSLPHQAAIQASFGHHDVSGIRAHVGGAASEAAGAIGALAYATGDDVAFASEPDLHQAAHEAAHVVQQRGQEVRLDGGVGRAGDVYEQHADAVADRVVRGESAEALLDTMAHRGTGGGPAVQRLDSHDVVGNTMSATGSTASGALDGRSERRVFERIAELEGRDPRAAGEEFAAMDAATRETALRDAVTRFQASPQGRALIAEISGDNAVTRSDGSDFYERPRTGALSEYTAPEATYTPGEARLNDVTMQALANAWPQTLFGRLMNEEQAYQVLRRMVLGRSLPFDAAAINVIGVRAYQGGAIHDNGEAGAADDSHRPFTAHNRFDDTTFILSEMSGAHQVVQSRATVDPGGESRFEFAVAADQQWDYSGNARGSSAKYDRPLYGMPDAMDVHLGRYWQEHPEEVDAAIARTGRGDGGGRIIRREDGRTEVDRDGAGSPRVVSAVHSGGRGGRTGEETGGDSIGCSVVHGAWFAHFNESLRRAAGGDRVRFTYSLIDPRTYSERELQQILDSVVQPERPAATAEPRTSPGEEPTRMVPYEMVPEETPRAVPLHPDGGITDERMAPAEVHRAAQAGVAGSAEALPHAAAIQSSFGHHDVSAVRAHVGGAAAEAADAIGARAYATGDDVAFAGPPDLRQAAHEAAHVVQQRGGVRLDGGVGRAGDPYEQHADAVAERVVRGESAEALLDTMAHRGAAGGPAVQRVAETHAQLTAALAAVDVAADLEPTRTALAALHPHLPADRNTEYTVPIGGSDHTIRGADVRWLTNQVQSREQAIERMGPAGSGVWDGTSAPLRGQTIGGHTIEADGSHKIVRVSGVRLQLAHRAVWGVVFYDSDSLGRLHAAAERVAVREAAAGNPYRAAAARGMQVTGEGGIAAINTYDGMTFTLGPGYAGDRLNHMLASLAGSPAGAALAAVPYLAGGRFNGSEDIIRDVDALARIVNIIRAHEDAVAEAEVVEWIRASAMSSSRGAAGETEGNALASRVMPELIGVAAYLRHGLPAYAPDPIGDATRAANAYPSSPSRQLAVVLKLYAQRVSASPPGQSLLATILDDRIPNKVVHFIRAATARDPSFVFNLAEAQAEIPCLELSPPWPHVTAAPTGVSLHLTRNGGEWWNFGTPIDGS